MRYALGALLGAIIAILPGIPAFTTWETADSKPALFDVYCDVDLWAGEADCPSGKTVLVAGVGGAGRTRRRHNRIHRGRASGRPQIYPRQNHATPFEAQRLEEPPD